ncbi:hypothetical protein AU825_24340 [Salmonella enterica subsp. salamae]|nr:hypothetical protein [Salmonella enterica subsp. salamae]
MARSNTKYSRVNYFVRPEFAAAAPPQIAVPTAAPTGPPTTDAAPATALHTAAAAAGEIAPEI